MLLIAQRIGEKEQAMLDQFGERYLAYMAADPGSCPEPRSQNKGRDP